MPQAVNDSQSCKEQQRDDLDRIDHDIDHRRSGHAAVGDIRDAVGGEYGHERHENRPGGSGIKSVRRKIAYDISDHDADRGNHRARINPIVKVRAPSDYEFGKAGETVRGG